MPLKQGKSNTGYNIAELMKGGKHPKDQAIAIALSILKRKKKK